MTTLYRELMLETDAAHAWRALRNPGDAARAFAGVLVDCTLAGDTRTVTFANGNVAEERIVAIDEARMRVAYTVLGNHFEHHHASMQIVPDAPGRCRLVWISDLLPDAPREWMEPLVDAGCLAFARNAVC